MADRPIEQMRRGIEIQMPQLSVAHSQHNVQCVSKNLVSPVWVGRDVLQLDAVIQTTKPIEITTIDNRDELQSASDVPYIG